MKQKIANKDYGIPTSLLRFLGACVYGDPVAYYGGLNESERVELDAQDSWIAQKLSKHT